MKTLFTFLLISFSLSAQHFPFIGGVVSGSGGLSVNVAALSPTQAVLTYTAPNSSACQVQISQSPSLSPLIHDVDSSLFTGSDMDNRAGALNGSGNVRVFIAGTRGQFQTGSDSNNYSRALAQNTTHYYQIACSPEIATGSFTTPTLPVGDTFADLPYVDSTGTYMLPYFPQTRGTTVIDPQTGVNVNLVNLTTDNNPGQTPGAAPIATPDGFDRWCNDLTDSNGNFLCMINDNAGLFPNLYSFNTGTGVINYLGSAYYSKSQINPSAFNVAGVINGAAQYGAWWDDADPDVAWTYVQLLLSPNPNISTIVKYTYLGNSNSGLSSFSIVPSYAVVDMLGGADLTNLVNAFDSRVDPSVYGCNVENYQAGYILGECYRLDTQSQNTISFIFAYAVGNKLPLGSGGNGHVQAVAQMWSLPGSRWCGNHTQEYVGQVAISSTSVHGLTGSLIGGGPYYSQLVGNMTPSTTTITVTSSYSTPGEPVSTFAPTFLQTAATGDAINMTNGSGQTEVMLLSNKISPTSWGITRAQGGTTALSFNTGTNILMDCQSDLSTDPNTNSGGYIWWDFVNSPDGTNTADYVMNFGAHPVSRGNYRVSSGWPWRAGAVTDKTTWGQPPTNDITANPQYTAYAYGLGDGNTYQKHPAMASISPASFFDNTYSVLGNLFSASDSSATVNITGNLYQYIYSGGAGGAGGLTPKYLPTLAKTFQHVLTDVSGPTSLIGGTTADNYKYCIAYAANECVSGSSAGNIYFNLTTLTVPYCDFGVNGTTDICIGNSSSSGMFSGQYVIANDSTGVSTYRPLTRMYQTFQDAAFGVPQGGLKMLADGSYALLAAYTNSSTPLTNLLAIQVPPIPTSDGVNRSQFIPATLNLTAPTGLSITKAWVKFGYAEYGTVGASGSQYYCRTRREACVSTTSTVTQGPLSSTAPYSWITSDSPTALACSTSCSISIPVDPEHIAYFSVEYMTSGGSVVATQQGVAQEGNVVWN